MSIFIHFVKFDFGLRNKLSPVSLPHAFGMGGSDVFLYNLLPTPSEIKFSFITIIIMAFIIMAFIMVIKINWAKSVNLKPSLSPPSNPLTLILPGQPKCFCSTIPKNKFSNIPFNMFSLAWFLKCFLQHDFQIVFCSTIPKGVFFITTDSCNCSNLVV